MSQSHVRRMATLFDLVAAEYDQHVPFFTVYAERFVPWLGVQAGDDVLDIGIGRGAVARQAQAAGARVVGVDVSPSMLKMNQAQITLMDAQHLGLRDDSFDVAAGAFSIHLLPDPRAGVAEAARVLRPGGTFGVAFGGRAASSRWDFYLETLRRYSVYAQGEPLMPPVVPFGDPRHVLGSAGLVDIEVLECDIHVPIVDGETFLRGELAHGFRSLFEVVPPGPRLRMEAELLERLEQMRTAGGIILDQVAVFAKGMKPQSRSAPSIKS